MQLSGTIIAQLPVVSGEGRNGVWRNQDFVIETFDQYPKKVCFQISGNLIDTTDTRPGQEVAVDFNIESREYNGRWFTTCKAWRVGRFISETEKYQQKQASHTPNTPPVQNYQPDPNIVADDEDTLPF